MNTDFRQAKFLLSVAKFTQLPADDGCEIAFAGRSNAGKSSVLNVLTDQKSLARVSKTPGRTQLINFFQLTEHQRLVDLPGYGYAQVAESVKRHWQNLLDNYLNKRQCLTGLVVIMDIRHPLKEFDQHMLAWAEQKQLAVHIVLNKSDKLGRSGSNQAKFKVLKAVGKSDRVTCQTFSALKKDGLTELQEQLTRWLNPSDF